VARCALSCGRAASMPGRSAADDDDVLRIVGRRQRSQVLVPGAGFTARAGFVVSSAPAQT
jgi:hypothetical protein